MNRHKDRAISAVGILAVCAILILACVSGPANAQVDYVLMVQQTPADGGSVSPESGVHNISANGAVTVVARPKPGYQFVYWLGDVADSTSSSTVVSVNAPKIVVAVFQRSEYELPFEEPSPADGAGGGGGRLVPNRQFYGSGAGINPASGPAHVKFGGPTYIINQPPTDSKTNDEYQVPTPEPATVLLLGIGAVLAIKRKK